MKDVLEVCEFLNKCGTFYIATTEGDQPRVRPFGVATMFEGRLYIQTGHIKDVSKQMAANPKIEICGMVERRWIRISATVVEDDRLEAKQFMLDANPKLKNLYSADDGNTEVLYLTNATARLCSYTAEPEVIRF